MPLSSEAAIAGHSCCTQCLAPLAYARQLPQPLFGAASLCDGEELVWNVLTRVLHTCYVHRRAIQNRVTHSPNKTDSINRADFSDYATYPSYSSGMDCVKFANC